MEIQKVFSNIEDPEETLYSVLMSEDEVALFSEIKEKEEKKSSKLGTAGKVALGTGLVTSGVAGTISNKIGDKVMKNAASKYGVDKVGYGLMSKHVAYGPFAQERIDKASKVVTRAIKGNKNFKRAITADRIGTAATLTGAGLMAANHFINKKKKNKE